MNPQNQPQGTKSTTVSAAWTDPVCGSDVKSGDTNMKRSTFRGQNYSFCGEACRQKFEADPEQYAQQAKSKS